jgi:hypothetical protein
MMLSFLIFLISVKLWALPEAERALPFFKSPQSLFESGRTLKSTLNQNLLSEISLNQHLVQSGQRFFWLRHDEVITAEHFAGPIPLAFPILHAPLRTHPHWKSETGDEVFTGQALQILEIQNAWIKVKNSAGSVGFLDSSNLILGADLAEKFQLKSNEITKAWHELHYRQLTQLIDKKGQSYSLNQVVNWRSKPQTGIILKANLEKGIFARSHVKVVRSVKETWKVSKLQGHGEVYWIDRPEPTSSILTTQEILHREITSAAFAPKPSDIAIVSARGIFLTLDGKKWRKLEAFGQKDLPVGIGPKGDFFVGHYWSRDQGLSFKSYLKFDQLAKLLAVHLPKFQTQFNITKLTPLPDLQMELQVSVDSKNFILVGYPLYGNWSLKKLQLSNAPTFVRGPVLKANAAPQVSVQ